MKKFLALTACLIPLGLTTISPAHAAEQSAGEGGAIVWADFQDPAVWNDPTDSLHWYVGSPVISPHRCEQGSSDPRRWYA